VKKIPKQEYTAKEQAVKHAQAVGVVVAAKELGLVEQTLRNWVKWIARARDEESGPTRQRYESLGDFSALPEHQRFDAASKATQAWFDHLGRGGTAGGRHGRAGVRPIRQTSSNAQDRSSSR